MTLLYAVSTPAPISTTTPISTPAKDPQRVQIMRAPDGRLTVKGLMPGQQLVQFPDGKLQVLTTTQVATTPTKPTTPSVPAKQQIIKPAVSASTPAGKLAQLKPIGSVQKVLQPQQQQAVLGQAIITPKTQLIKPPTGQVLQKIAQSGTSVVTSGQQVVQQQVVVGTNQVISTQGGQQVSSQFSSRENFLFCNFSRLSPIKL